jgi:hypothetical protein
MTVLAGGGSTVARVDSTAITVGPSNAKRWRRTNSRPDSLFRQTGRRRRLKNHYNSGQENTRSSHGSSTVYARACLFLLLSLAVGCSKPIEVPRLDPKDLADKALAQYDSNKDGVLDARELERCPGLKTALPRFDKDKDGRFSRAELEEYFQLWVESKTGLQQALCRVTLDNQPLAGATVVLEPEAFMGDSIKPASGVTDDKGEARFQIAGAPQSGCHLGIYRVRISKTIDGKEVVPVRYNTDTQLGLEVSSWLRGRTVFHLKSRS